MKLVYIANFSLPAVDIANEVPWVDETAARKECFMSDVTRQYQYLRNGPVYQSVPMQQLVGSIMDRINLLFGHKLNVCFLNHYSDQSKALGWHADDAEQIDQTQPIAVVSFGQARDIWFRLKGAKGVVPPEDRVLLGHGSLLIMPAGFQHTHEHRIPKGDRLMKARTSLTYRCWKD